MAEAKAAAPTEKAAKKKTPQMEKKKETKSKWTQERCTKSAKRFHSMESWKQGAPSSFKAAEARGWLKECGKFLNPKLAPLKKSSGMKRSA